MSQVNAKIVANYFLSLSKPNTVESITNLKLQKLLYYVQGFNLAINNTVLFSEKIEAWAHGPVVPDVYREFKGFGYKDIVIEEDYDFSELTTEQKKIIRDVWEVFKFYDGKELEKLSHSESPWKDARVGLAEYDSSNAIISADSIKEYFVSEYMISE
ncbi:Panacea domain-containing protein [Exiguobacterium sp. s140]|uniref:Panacea domain-containing protein n=1 Tax=Exiguobacterium sp. s140 TaxID=2751290 RepID=UPI001BE6D484|nr:type II toxin-antitoxin system antitoxin SocA domain-containing protein [Exiguobacterium sp. s140]